MVYYYKALNRHGKALNINTLSAFQRKAWDVGRAAAVGQVECHANKKRCRSQTSRRGWGCVLLMDDEI